MRSLFETAFSVAILTAYGTLASGQCVDKQLALLNPNDLSQNANFGIAVDIDGDRAVVGARSGNSGPGAAYVYHHQGGSWNQVAKLVPTDSTTNDFFGQAVAIKGDRIVVGADGADNPTIADGAVYVFEYIGSSWVETAKLTAKGSDGLGDSVDVDDDRIIARSPGVDIAGLNAGGVYVYDLISGAWVTTTVLVPNNLPMGYLSGMNCKVEGGRIVFGSSEATAASGSGAVYVFEIDSGSWTQTAKIVASEAAQIKFFGHASLSLQDSRIAVGTESGTAFVYEQVGVFWVETAKITSPDAGAAQGFGESVSLDGPVMCVGAARESTEGFQSGAAYVFVLEGETWVERMKLKASDVAPNAYFGQSVALSSNVALVGAPNAHSYEGRSYLFSTMPNPPAEYGLGCPGSGDEVPAFILEFSHDGCAVPASSLAFTVSNGLGGSSVLLFFGLAPAQIPLGGGCDLLLALTPLNIALPLLGSGPGNGAISFSATIPLTTPPLSIYGQGFIADPGGALGFSATNGVRITVQ